MTGVEHPDRSPSQVLARDALLITLMVASGAVDAVSWLGLGGFSAFMTGNLAFLGFVAGGAEGPALARVIPALAGFAVGAALAARVVRGPRDPDQVWPRRVTIALAVTLAFQIAFAIAWASVSGHPSSTGGDALIALSACAMGVQTAAIFTLGVRGLFTTAATATLVVLMGDLAVWSRSTAREAVRLFSALVGLLAGAAIGTVLFLHVRSWAPVLPIVLTALVVVAATLAFAPEPAGRRRLAPPRGPAEPSRTTTATDGGHA